MNTDLHAHYVPPDLTPAALADAQRYGIRRVGPEPGARLSFGAETLRDPPAFLLDLRAHRRFMEAQGLDVLVLSSWIDMQGYLLPPAQGDAWCRLLNRHLAEAVRGDAHLLGLGAVPLQDPARAADVLDEAMLGLGLKGVQIGTHIGAEGLDGRALDPFWRRAEALGAAVLIHPFDLDPPQRVRRYGRPWMVANPFDTVLAATDLMFGGVIDRFPDLRVLLCHGGGFLPYQAGRVQRGFETSDELRRALRGTPRDYLRWFFYDSVLGQPEALHLLIEMVGIEQVVLGSDYPYALGDLTPLGSLSAAGLGGAEVRRIAQDNPARLLAPAGA